MAEPGHLVDSNILLRLSKRVQIQPAVWAEESTP